MDPEPALFISISTVTTITFVKWALLGILLTASALISGAEVAFFSLTPSVLEQAKEEGKRQVARIKAMLKKPKRLLATILVANNFINIAIVLLFASLSEGLFIGIENAYLQLFIEVVVITFIILLFGEILPKIYANRNNLVFSLDE